MEEVDSKVLYGAIRKELLDEDEDEGLADFVSEGEEDVNAMEPPCRFDGTFPKAVVVTGLPKAPKSKFDKLLGVVSKFFDKSGPNEKHMPINEETGMTDGFMIVAFETEEAVNDAVQKLDGFKLDKAHTFKLVKMDKFEQVVGRSDDFVPQRTVKSFSRVDFRDWLTDRKCREQLLLRYQTETEIYWNDAMEGRPVLQYGAAREKAQGMIWCDWRVHWSPQGSYMATYHQQGIALWAGPEFEKKVRFPHHGTKACSFAPSEEYIMLWNGEVDTSKKDSYALFHVLTGELVKTFACPSVSPLIEDKPLGGVEAFPHFLWSADGQFFAECKDDRIIVRDTKTFDVLPDEKGKPGALKFDQLSTFQWSPKDPIIAAWTLEKDNNPARLTLIELPSRKELTSRSRTQCEATIHWQSEGDYFCLLVTKLSKTNKKISVNVELFRMRERGIPVDTVTVTDMVRGFFWENKGNRFAVLTTDEAGSRPRLLIYALGKEKTEEIVNFDLPSNSFNNLFWAPDGQYFVVAATGQGGGDLLFCGLTQDNKLDILYKDEHFMLTDVQWDPSSRYVITAVTQPHANESGGYKYSMEAGYAIRTFQGRILYRAQKEKLYEIHWRPHPPSLLPSTSQKDIRKNIKQFSKKYDAIDDQAKEAARQSFKREREEKTNAFQSVLDRLSELKAEKEEENGWGDAVADFLEGQGWMQDDTFIEDALDVTEELIPS